MQAVFTYFKAEPMWRNLVGFGAGGVISDSSITLLFITPKTILLQTS
jgi:hypothetical protein